MAVFLQNDVQVTVNSVDLTDHVAVVSFDDDVVDTFRALAPDVAVSPGVGAMSAWLLSGEPLDPTFRIVQVPPFFGAATAVDTGDPPGTMPAIAYAAAAETPSNVVVRRNSRRSTFPCRNMSCNSGTYGWRWDRSRCFQ